MAYSASEVLNVNLAEARRAARIGETLATLQGSIALADLLFEAGVDQPDGDWAGLQAAAANTRSELEEAIERVGENGELLPPEGHLFAVWSPVHSTIETSRRLNDEWRADIGGMSLLVDTRIYADPHFIIDPTAPITYQVPLANVIKNEPSGSPEPGALYAYSPSGISRYKIGDPDYQVAILPEPASKGILYVRPEGGQDFRQMLVE